MAAWNSTLGTAISMPVLTWCWVHFAASVSCVEQVPSVFCLWLGLWLLSSGPEEDHRFFLASRSVEGVIVTVNSANKC